MASWDGSYVEQDNVNKVDSSSWNYLLDNASAASTQSGQATSLKSIPISLDNNDNTSQVSCLLPNSQDYPDNLLPNLDFAMNHTASVEAYNAGTAAYLQYENLNLNSFNNQRNSNTKVEKAYENQRRKPKNFHYQAERNGLKSYNSKSHYRGETQAFERNEKHKHFRKKHNSDLSFNQDLLTSEQSPKEPNSYVKARFTNRDTKASFNRNGYHRTNKLPHEISQKTINWRHERKDNRFFNKAYEPEHNASQRERLTELLNRGILECLVCCDHIKQADYVWSCKNCYHVLHLSCIRKWATSSQAENQWRCPACQNVSLEIPQDYECFCGKLRAPEWNRRDTAHSCGEACAQSKSACAHKCTLLCHPGSCPPCNIMVTKLCGCGKLSQTQKCSSGPMLICNEICGKSLNCKKHYCKRKCHHGDCEDCSELVVQECFCGKSKKESVCIQNLPLNYSCTSKCLKKLDCNNHVCQEVCHQGSCQPCSLSPEAVISCCCSQTPITSKRASCLDPVPVCDKICSKPLKCGQPSEPHVCQSKCHKDECPECKLTTKVKCRCGYMDKEIPCVDLKSKADDARCDKKCTKKRSCGKHKCNQLCCIDIEHLCPLPCSKNLSCGKHKCELTCHKGRCQTCWRSSFDELYCECGSAVIYPPVPCGTKRPDCNKPCSRDHSCSHEVFHACHSDATCPPCTVLSERWCYGKHELRKAIPCYVTEISCGRPCSKPLPCGNHKCITLCHSGECGKPGQVCLQPCTIPRNLCGHACGAPCHKDKCPETPCKEMVKVTCQCGNRSMMRVCAENSRDYQRISGGILASKMAAMQLGHYVDLEEVFGQGNKKQNQLKTLECNEECKIIERNRRLSLGLQIVNPDLSGKLAPRYSDFMKQWGKKDPMFCQAVHEKLAELVQLAKVSKQKSRSYSFEVMNRDKRHFVHEACEAFGCESQAYDQEPKRNVVATAVKDKCWLPSYSLLEVLKREAGQRSVPGPVISKSKLSNTHK